MMVYVLSKIPAARLFVIRIYDSISNNDVISTNSFEAIFLFALNKVEHHGQTTTMPQLRRLALTHAAPRRVSEDELSTKIRPKIRKRIENVSSYKMIDCEPVTSASQCGGEKNQKGKVLALQ